MPRLWLPGSYRLTKKKKLKKEVEMPTPSQFEDIMLVLGGWSLAISGWVFFGWLFG